MKKWIVGCMMALGLAGGAQAAGAGFPLDKAPDRVTDMAALQHGAKLFTNYCLSCHSAAFMRYNRLKDIGLTEKQIKENLVFATDKVGDVMKATIDPVQAKEWFGANPPDLTLVARSRASGAGSGADYLYTYMRTFYRDDTRPTGWNNAVFPNVGMPHVFWELQGERKPVFDEHQQITGWEQVKPGQMTPEQYDNAVGDLVAFMQWMAEPAQTSRKQMGYFVLAFLAVFTFVAWRLNASFWKDVK